MNLTDEQLNEMDKITGLDASTMQAMDKIVGYEPEQPKQVEEPEYNGPTISAYKKPNVLDNLKSAWDFVTQVPVAAFMEQKKDNEAAELRTKGMLLRKAGQDLSDEEKARIEELDNPYSKGRYNQANNYGIYSKFVQTSDGRYFQEGSPEVLGERLANGAKQLYAEVMKQTAILYSIGKEAGILGGIGGAGGLIVGAIGGAVTTKTPQGAWAGGQTGMRTGASLFARTAVAKKSFELEAGFMRQELEQLNQEFISTGVEPLNDSDMDNLSMSVGLINASLEYLGLGAVLKAIPNGDKIMDMFGKQGIKELAKDKTFRSQLAALSMELAKAGIEEGSTEMAQEYTNFVYGNLARKMRGVAPKPLADKLDEIMQAGLVGAVSSILMGGVGTTAQVAAVKTKQGIDSKLAKKEAENMTLDERNDFLTENMDTLAEVATEQADEKVKTLKAGISYNRIKDEMQKQGANEEFADTSAQFVQQLENVITDKFGDEGKELLRKSNLQILINQNNNVQALEEARFIDSALKERQEQSFKPSELLTDAKTFQYKDNSDENGVTDRMNGVEEFDPLYAGDIIVYERKDGKKYVVDGHQRLGLAKRTGGDNITLKGYLFKETDGYTPEQMRVLAAQKNIAENSGTALDTAKIIKEVGLENLPKTIPTNSAMVKDGIALSRLGDTAFQKVVNGEVTAAQGARIADIIRNDEEKQITAINGVRIAKFNNLEQVAMFAREVLAASTVKSEQINLFGTQELLETTAIEKIQIVDKAVKSLKSDKKLFSGLLRNNSRITGRGKNKLDKVTNERINQQAAVAIELIEHLASVVGPISDKALQLAAMVKSEEMTLDEAAKEFKAYMLTPEVIKEVFGKVKHEIAYNQTAISRFVNENENPYKSLGEVKDNENILIRPDEFYAKGLYQGPNVEDLANWRAKYPDIAADLAEQDRLKAEGKLPSTIDIMTEERIKLREDIAADLYGKGAKVKNKQAYIVIGGPASGKSSLADPLAKQTGSLIVDSDMAKERLPEFIESDGKRADQVHLESQRISEKVLEVAVENGDNILLPIVGKSEKSIMNKYNMLTEAGYDVHLRLVYLPLEKTVDRAVSRYRETGRLVPLDYIINEVGYNPLKNYGIMKEKGLFKSYEAVSTEVKYGEKPKHLEDEEIRQLIQGKVRQESNIEGYDGMEARSVGRGTGNNRGIVFNQSSNNNFDNFFGDSKAVDEDGKPKRLWHGAVSTFEIFDKEKAQPEGDMGAGFYFTDNENDADGNYHDGGPDFTNKVSRLADQIQNEYEENGQYLDYSEYEKLAEERLRGGSDPAMYEVYLRIENPCYVGSNETTLFEYDDIREQAEDRVNKEDFEDEDAYEEELQYATDDVIYEIQEEVTSNLYDLLSNDQIEEVRQVIADAAYSGGINLENLKKELNGRYLENYDTGEMVGNEVARRIVETLGYDGIIDDSVSQKFNMDMEAGTTHYIVFEPNQIKSVDNLGTFDRNDPNIYHQDEEAPRGQFRIDEDGTAIIDILQNGDPSTIVHELGHYYLYSLDTLAKGGNKRAQRELSEVYRVFGMKEDLQYTEDEMRDFHERFARGFEAYLMEGSAPSKSLLRVFQNFKDWLRQVYNSVKDLNVDLSDETIKLFDRVFTTDEEYQKEVLPKYQYNYAKSIELEEAINKPMYKFKKGVYDAANSISKWYDKLFIPLETRLGKISPELKDKLRNHTAQLALTTGKDLKVAAEFLKKTEAMKQQSKEDYLTFDLALKNRDEVMVRIIANKYGFTEDFNNVRELLEDIYSDALEVGIDVGYLDNYFPRLVKNDMSEKFIEYIEALARKEQRDVINQVIKLEDAKISMVLRDLAEADNSQFWNAEDRAKFINNHIRGFGKNNILLSRNASLKFERRIDELDGDFNQFYETFEPALINYISNSRKVIEARRFFGSEYKDVGKLRARIKRKKKTLDEVKDRYPNLAKAKELTRLKYELSPIEIKLEELENKKDLTPEQEDLKVKLQGQRERLRSQIEWVEGANAYQVKGAVINRLKKEIREASEEICKIIGRSENVEDSIGALVNTLAANGDIYAKDEKLIREMLIARFNASRICEPIKMVKDLTYIATLNDVTNAITQFGDLAFSVYKYGFNDTFKGLKKPFEISMEDLGINDLAYEFASPSKISKWLKKQFQLTGLTAIDGLGKNTIIQASLLKAQKLAKANNADFEAKLKRIYGDNWEAAKKDLAEGKVTDDTIIFAFHELSDIQPISEDQVTELYQSGGGFMKLFYTLKTYGIKALDIARQDVTHNIQQGIMNKNKGQVVKGLKNLIRLQMLLWFFGIPIDALKDLISNRDINIFETMIDNLIPTFIINRFFFKDAGKRGVGSAIVNFFTPSVAPVTTRVLSGKKSALAHIPLIGKPLYNWFLKDK